MSRTPVDRGAPVLGLQKTARDHRVPFNMVRALQNYRLPDRRLRRRRGFSEYGNGAVSFHGNQVAKHTGTKLQQAKHLSTGSTEYTREPSWKTPMSYSVIKHHDDFQPKIARDFSVEFLLTIGDDEPLVSYDPEPSTVFATDSGFNRLSPTRNGGAVNFLPRVVSGVFVYDQTIIANDVLFNDGGDVQLPTDPDAAAITNPVMFDCVSLPALSIVYNKALDGVDKGKVRFQVEWCVFDNATNKYYKGGTAGFLSYAHESYFPGSSYNIAVTYTAADKFVRLYVDGILRATSTDVTRGIGASVKWAGEEDYINEIDRPIRRDIVLLNEATVRGNYSSSCSFLNRGNRVSTVVGDWTEGGGADIRKWYITLNGKFIPNAVYFHDRAPTIPICKGVTTSYGKEEANLVLLSTIREWFYDAATKRLWIFTGVTGAGGDPVTIFKEIEAIFDYIGSPNIIPHMNEGSITSGPNTVEISQPNPWCCSPPRGTAMSELRIWHEARSAANLAANKLIPLTGLEANLKGYWRMNEGGSILIDVVAGKKMSIHHGLPSWVKDDLMLGQFGIPLADGQHLIKSFSKDDSKLFIDDIHTYLKSSMHVYQEVAYSIDVNPQSTSDFTFQIQIRTPHTFQQDLARHGELTKDGSWPQFDGGSVPMHLSEYQTTHGRQVCPAQGGGHMQTLFSFEGSMTRTATPKDNIEDLTKIPIVQGLLDDGGNIWFDHMARWHDGGNGDPQLYHIAAGKSIAAEGVYTGAVGAKVNRFTDAAAPFVSGDDGKIAVLKSTTGEVLAVSKIVFVSTTQVDIDWYWTASTGDTLTVFDALDPDTPYTLTFRKKTEDRGNIGGTSIFATWMDIFVDGVLLVSGRMARSIPVLHEANYDIVIGASRVNDIVDWSVTADDMLSGAEVVAGRPPWQKIPQPLNHSNQHFMTHHQDQPGDFVLGFFRMWAGIGISDELVEVTWDRSLESKFLDSHLVVNLELDQMTGTQIPNRCRYPTVFDMGYKGFGGTINNFILGVPIEDEAHIRVGWEVEDSLGYIPQNTLFDNQYQEASCKLLSMFHSTLRQQGGLLFIMDDCLLFDENLDGVFTNVSISAQGLLNDFSPGGFWEGVVIGDRTVLVGAGGVPKVFNGKTCTKAGIARWNGGRLQPEVLTGGKLTSDRWYHLRLVYHDAFDQIQAVSPAIVFKTSSTDKKVRIKNIPQHPDPRVTSIRIYSTPGHPSEELALGDTPKLTQLGVLENVTYSGGDSGIVYGDIHQDSDLLPVALALDVVPLPIMTTATSHNGRLIGSGNPLVPDAFFWSVAGNPETFLESNFSVLEEGTGDRVVKLISAFGSVFAFKTNSIWRLDETQPGAINPWVQTKLVEGLGAISNRAVALHVDPDTGRAFIFFWSKHGPYIFDGVNFIYVGQPLEQGLDEISWDWVDLTTLAVVHDLAEREIITFMRLSKGNVMNDVAYAFNYRNSSLEQGNFVWSEYTGMTIEIGLTALAVIDNTLISTNTAGDFGPINLTLQDKFLPLIAGVNGKIYEWGTSDYDGHPADLGDYVSKHTVTTFLGNIVTVSGAPAWGSMRGLWATIIKADYSDYYVWPIEHNIANGFSPSQDYGILPFNPSAGDFVYIGRAPARVEFPWDDIGLPFKDKEVHRIMLWLDKDHYFRWARNWSSTWEKAYKLKSDPAKKRVHVDLAPSLLLEVLKFELVSYEMDSRVDSYGFIASPTNEEDIVQ